MSNFLYSLESYLATGFNEELVATESYTSTVRKRLQALERYSAIENPSVRYAIAAIIWSVWLLELAFLSWEENADEGSEFWKRLNNWRRDSDPQTDNQLFLALERQLLNTICERPVNSGIDDFVTLSSDH